MSHNKHVTKDTTMITNETKNPQGHEPEPDDTRPIDHMDIPLIERFSEVADEETTDTTDTVTVETVETMDEDTAEFAATKAPDTMETVVAGDKEDAVRRDTSQGTPRAERSTAAPPTGTIPPQVPLYNAQPNAASAPQPVPVAPSGASAGTIALGVITMVVGALTIVVGAVAGAFSLSLPALNRLGSYTFTALGLCLTIVAIVWGISSSVRKRRAAKHGDSQA
ncbi:MAG: hypothetical protein UHD09_03660 [Bifidobacterium sp.]|nr:hypothetical protein [Bifidobacterium sp.]